MDLKTSYFVWEDGKTVNSCELEIIWILISKIHTVLPSMQYDYSLSYM